MVAYGEQIGTDMCLRTMSHLLQYGEPSIRKTVPLAIGLLRVSNPDVKTLDLLNKLAYDSDSNVALSAIFALGIVGAGTNNSKLATSLRQLATYYSGRDETQNQLFLVRISQGLVHMGKVSLSLKMLTCFLGLAWTEPIPLGQIPVFECFARWYVDDDLRCDGDGHFLLRKAPLLPVFPDAFDVPAHACDPE